MSSETSKILIVEDEDLIAVDLQQTLSKLDYKVAGIASSGKQAIQYTAATKPDLVLMDMTLKGSISGIEAAHELRDKYRVPVVFLTANTNPDTISRANETAPYGYLVKPWRSKELDATIRVALRQHRLLEETFAGQREQQEQRDRLEEEVQVTTQVLGQTRAELHALSAHLMRSQEDERQRIARDLHDDFGQRTALLDMNLDRLGVLVQARSDAAQVLKTIRKQMNELSAGLRRMSHNLHPAVLGDLGLVPGLSGLVEDFSSGGMRVRFHANGFSAEPSIEVSTALYRIVQEALRNTAKHAPNAAVKIMLFERNSDIQLLIEDSGPGFDLDAGRKNGIGLLSIQERAQTVGGSFLLRTAPERGTRIFVRVPVSRTDQQNLSSRCHLPRSSPPGGD